MNPSFSSFPGSSSGDSQNDNAESQNIFVNSSQPRGRPKNPLVEGKKRGRKPGKGAAGSPRIGSNSHESSPAFSQSSPQLTHVHWAVPMSAEEASGSGSGSGSGLGQDGVLAASLKRQQTPVQIQLSQSLSMPGSSSAGGQSIPQLPTDGLISFPGVAAPIVPLGAAVPARQNAAGGGGAGEEDGEGEDELLPAMADDDYSAQLSWQSQSKDNLKYLILDQLFYYASLINYLPSVCRVLMDNFSPAQYERFEAYRRHALPKQAVRKVIQQTLGQQVSQPVAQIVAGFAKVFVGEIIEKARAVQERRGDTGPLSPDHLREAYRSYQDETGRVGAARPLRSKRLFVR